MVIGPLTKIQPRGYEYRGGNNDSIVMNDIEIRHTPAMMDVIKLSDTFWFELRNGKQKNNIPQQ